jgi:hypothetical protein
LLQPQLRWQKQIQQSHRRDAKDRFEDLDGLTFDQPGENATLAARCSR